MHRLPLVHTLLGVACLVAAALAALLTRGELDGGLSFVLFYGPLGLLVLLLIAGGMAAIVGSYDENASDHAASFPREPQGQPSTAAPTDSITPSSELGTGLR